MIILHFHLQPQFKNELFHIYFTTNECCQLYTVFIVHLSGLLIGCGKKVKFRWIFRDKIAEKSANFAGIFRANLAGKQSVKKQQTLWLFSRQISLEIDQFCADQTSVFNVFQKWNNGKAFNIMASAQFFATYSIPGSLHVLVTKFWHKFAILRQVNCNTPSSWDKFQNCCTDMYLIRFLGNFAVFCVFLWIFAGFRGFTWISRLHNRAKYQKPSFIVTEFSNLKITSCMGFSNFWGTFYGFAWPRCIRTLKLFFCFVLTSLFSFFHFTCDLNKFLH